MISAYYEHVKLSCRYMNGDVANINKDEEVDPVITALNLIVQRQAAQQGFRFGKNRYFFPEENRVQIGPNLDALMGFYSSVRPCNKLVMVNVNVCMSAFHKPGNLSDALRAFGMGSFDAAPRELMRKVKVSTNYLGYKRIKTINRVQLGSSAKRHRFSCEELGGMVSVEEYFLRSGLSYATRYPQNLTNQFPRAQHPFEASGRDAPH